MDLATDFGLEAPSREHAGMRFLIIDDSITMRRIIANILGRLGYPEVVHASNGREALDRLATETIDIVITDWYMPEMNGLDFVKALRTTPATCHIPIVIVTANAASDDIQHALELGVNSYILKPFTVETMRDKIAVLLAQTGMPAAPVEGAELSTPQPDAAVMPESRATAMPESQATAMPDSQATAMPESQATAIPEPQATAMPESPEPEPALAAP